MSDYDVKPVMAHNPHTDKLVNVEPFFDFLRTQQEAKVRMNQIVRMIVMLLSDTDDDHKMHIPEAFNYPSDMYLFLYDLCDLFEKTAECEISIPKKKGGC